ncbi:MAG TPA: DoxX family protein [Porphyromonadaceae bacterium]|jgi:putative oxidoreductase|uniref:DoxX family protein n=1 Tax=Limibacterium fermenti TaxID=3229863 RepID=UPI000E92A0F0|nr:DoxX family protein [Porphyromonadaceae bacterium]HBK32530.1 DoxX family protein [Porphyromonadaceae bacterium]HBL34870.1 DoxX family protein [Porphyromonadaceae bacterium]HBX20691.1 DoxX family protein [Porphyromonadaceae bacterium]HBX46694.1 DoxX family protein [Porphyromonadaceae bacterium]
MTTKEKLLHTGLLVLRIGIGISFFFHGLPKVMGGVEGWTQVGSTMALFGLDFAPAFWGFMAAMAETVGGILFALGFLFRPASLMMAFTMIVALIMHLSNGDAFLQYSHALESLILFAAMTIAGPGRYSVDAKFLPKIS